MDHLPGLSLTNDLWAHIFSLAAKEVIDTVKEAIDKLNAIDQGPNELSFREEYIQLHSMRLVCKKFNDVFFEHPELSASLFLGASSSVKAFTSLLGWMQRDSNVVEELLAICDLTLLARLSGVIVAGNRPLPSLKRAMLHNLSDSEVGMLALCTNLTSCCFGGFGELDLEPLQARPNLSHLSLRQGSGAGGIGKLAMLTELDVARVSVRGDNTAQFVHGLKRLSVSAGTIEGLHDLGVAACSGLQDLSLVECHIPATDQYTVDITLVETGYLPPLSLTQHLYDLTQLTTLRIIGSVEADFKCPSVFLLTNLVCLDLTFDVRIDNEVTQYVLTDQLGVLRSLTHFALRLSASKGLTLVLEVSWHMMLLLQTVIIAAPRSMFDKRIMGFAQLTALKTL